ncbi:MAG: carboxypeptidase regulatory-like domain-containing protein [Nanoarchaeota archaeon]|nr:carboxypeptidase regulatory-like domain-containing protein [Nanoarchaeota archaeon]MCG2718696.1 carboxypeptidase regulatory-like domain-containing protein [Nanoarchaeota archaeon]
MKKILFPLIFLVLINTCLAATIQGTIYDESLSVLENAVVEVDSTPQQRYVAKDGTYSFNLPEGSYTITTKYNGQIAEEKVTITQDGEYVLDLFLFPSFEEEDELLEDIGINLEDEYFEEEKEGYNPIIAGITAVVMIVAVLFYFLHRSRKLKIKVGIEDINEDETKKYLEFIKKQGGRTTQKEIRKNFPMSEAKISLIITELEHKGKIKKIRKGRSNVIILNK